MDQTYADFVSACFQRRQSHPSERAGQAAFNALHVMRPDLSERVRSTDLDPFYSGDRLADFFGFVEREW